MAPQSVRRQDPRAQEGRRARGLRPIGTEFHRWLRGDHERIGLGHQRRLPGSSTGTSTSTAASTSASLRPRRSARSPGLECVHPTTPSTTSPCSTRCCWRRCRSDDDRSDDRRKFELVGRFARHPAPWRIWNFRAIDYSTMQYAMFIVMREIRGWLRDTRAQALHDDSDAEQETFDSNDASAFTSRTARQLHRLLARITDYVETSPASRRSYVELRQAQRQGAIRGRAHLGRPPRATHRRVRPRHGLRRVPKPDRRPAAAAEELQRQLRRHPYEKKLPHYNTQNLLAASLHRRPTRRTPASLASSNSGLPFKAIRGVQAGRSLSAATSTVRSPNGSGTRTIC